MTTSTLTTTDAANLNTVLQGDCIQIMRQMQPASVDFVITDPPYITRYAARDGRTVANDDNARWLKPAFAQMHRVLKSAAFCVSFYGWNRAAMPKVIRWYNGVPRAEINQRARATPASGSSGSHDCLSRVLP
jgi:DNA modification methylase